MSNDTPHENEPPLTDSTRAHEARPSPSARPPSRVASVGGAEARATANSICHRLPAGLKLALTLALIAFSNMISLENWPLLAALTCLVLIGMALAGVTVSYLIRRLVLFVPMVLMLALAVPLSHGFQEGGELALTILARSLFAFLCGLWLIQVLPFEDLVSTLRRWRAPAVLTLLMMFMYRYVYLLWGEMEKMRTARRARAFGRRRRSEIWREGGSLIGMLLIRSMTRAERVHAAMLARGWTGRAVSLDDARRDQARRSEL